MHYISYPSLAHPYSHPCMLVANIPVITRDDSLIEPQSPFPIVDTKRLNASTKKFQKLMKQADLLAVMIVNSDEFAINLMDAAQHSDTVKVQSLVLSTGITSKVETKFTPSGIRIKLDNSEEGHGDCCNLTMLLHW